MNDVCYLNGRIVPLSEAAIHPLDRGLAYGDGVYEVVKIVCGAAVFLDAHLRRLRHGLEQVGIPIPSSLKAACSEVLAASGLETGSLFIQLTRGVAPRAHFPPRDLSPTHLVIPDSHSHPEPASLALEAVTAPDWRWSRCDIKTTSRMGTVLGKLRARDRGADEVLFLSDDGELREGGSTNVFVRRQEKLESYPLGPRILPGVTRELVLELAASDGIAVTERAARLDKRHEWQELFVTSTTLGVQGVVRVDEEPVADGRVGTWTRRLARLYAEAEERALGNSRADVSPPTGRPVSDP